MMTKKGLFAAKLAALLSIIIWGLPLSTWASPTNGKEWLQMMALSGEALNYSGSFIVFRNGEISTLKVSHMGSEQGGVKKISSVDGQQREIVSSQDAVSCLLPDLNMGVREARQSTIDQYFPMNFNGNMNLLDKNYDIHLGADARVADRGCQQLAVQPKDTFRYGYLLCIDKQNYLLLSSDLVGADGKALESYRFVDVNFDQVTKQTLAPEVEAASLNWMGDEGHDENMQEQSIWALNDDNPNFEINHSLTRFSPVLQSQIHHIVLSDGLVNVSAFVVPDVSEAKDVVKELSMGALNSYTRMVDEYKLTVLGEVPKETVNLLAEAMYMQQ